MKTKAQCGFPLFPIYTCNGTKQIDDTFDFRSAVKDDDDDVVANTYFIFFS